MKAIYRFAFCILATLAGTTSCYHEIGELESKYKNYDERLENIEGRVTTLEQLCKEMNTNISSLQALVTALQNNDYVTGVSPVTQGTLTIGYTISFSKSGPITIYHGTDGKDGADGKDGKDGVDGTDGKDGADGKDGTDGKDGVNGADGKDGSTPIIGVALSADGIYYWTLNGSWLLDADGNKIQASGKNGADGKDGINGNDGADGNDGKDGANGTDGKDGKDGITPQLKIEDGYWYISYDNGTTWTQLGKATGEDGTDGANGQDGKEGDSMFLGVDFTSDPNYVIFTLSDGTQITLPTWAAFEALQRKVNELNTNLSSLQTIVNALQDNDYVTGVAPYMQDGKQIGYTITFSKSGSIVIYNGKDGVDGNDGVDGTNGTNGLNGSTPQIGLRQDSDGNWYWTVDGDWLLDADGNKVRANGIDGHDGTDGSDGTNGTNGANGSNGANGQDGITPQLKIDGGYWYISYDNGTTWTQLGKATGEDGTDGNSAIAGFTQDDKYVYITLSDGTILNIPKYRNLSFEFTGRVSYGSVDLDNNNLYLNNKYIAGSFYYTIEGGTGNYIKYFSMANGVDSTNFSIKIYDTYISIAYTGSQNTTSDIIFFISDGENTIMKKYTIIYQQ